MNRTLKESTVRRYHYDTHQQFEDHLAAFYNFAWRLKILRGLTPYEAICKTWDDVHFARSLVAAHELSTHASARAQCERRNRCAGNFR
jgi:hypothetical protein